LADLSPEKHKLVYEHLLRKGVPILTIRCLLGLPLDGVDRLALLIGAASEYEYRLLDDESFRLRELEIILDSVKDSQVGDS